MNYFVHGGRLPTLNEYTSACRGNKYVGAQMKSDAEETLRLEIIDARNAGKLKPVNEPVFVEFSWNERTAKRDPDNIAFAKKFVFDALVKNGILPNDSPKYVKGFADCFAYGEECDGVIVSIKPAKVERLAHDDLYRAVAALIARGSGCKKRQYGAVIVKDDRIIAEGYNAPAAGEKHCTTCRRADVPHNTGEYGDCPAVHAEANAIAYCVGNGIDTRGATLYLAGYDHGERIANPTPCPICAELVQKYGLTVKV